MRTFEFLAICNNKRDLLNYLHAHNIVPKEKKCGTCNDLCIFEANEFIFRCIKNELIINADGQEQSIACENIYDGLSGTCFEHVELPVANMCMFICYFLLMEIPRQEFIASELNLSSSTFVRCSDYCRQVFLYLVEQNSEQIGGNWSTVEIYEGLRRIGNPNDDKSFFFGGIDRESNKMFMAPVINNNSQTLLDVLNEYIHPNTKIVCHCWEGHGCPDNEDCKIFAVNHRLNFIDPIYDSQEQHLVRVWNEAGENYLQHGTKEERLFGYRAEFEFMRKHEYNHRINAFFEILAKLYPIPRE